MKFRVKKEERGKREKIVLFRSLDLFIVDKRDEFHEIVRRSVN